MVRQSGSCLTSWNRTKNKPGKMNEHEHLIVLHNFEDNIDIIERLQAECPVFGADKTMDKYNMEDLRTVEAQIASLVKTRDKILAGMADENKKLTNDSSQVVCDGMKDFTCVKKLGVDKDTVVCYQGVPGAYSQQAMFRFFGKEIQNINVPDFGDVIEMVKDGKADYGVLPIENSSAGFVNGIYDMVGNNDVTIVGEEEVHVAHALMGVPGSDLSRIKTVYSHTQGLLQCTNYLSRKPWKQCSVANTAVAAVKVIEEGDKTQAAIASELAAELYGLQILAKDIVNNDNNTTRFIILSKQKIFVEKAENISIRFSLPDESGTLYNILSHINLNGINMTSIESRPLTGRKWEYAFFVTMEGSLLDSRTRHALQGICEDAMDFRLIGTY